MGDKIKLVVIGDGTVGKTSLLISYTSSTFPEEYVPTVFDNHRINVQVEDRTVSLDLYDTAVCNEYTIFRSRVYYDQLRPMSYPHTDVFLICFSVMDKESFLSIDQKWIPELRKYQVSAPFFLIGTKCDLLEETTDRENTVDEKTVREYSHKMGAAGYSICSAKTRHNLENTINNALLVVLDPSKSNANNTANGTGKRQSNSSGGGSGGNCCILC